MPRGKKGTSTASQKKVVQYEHKKAERANNPHVGLVTPDTDLDEGKKKYAYDPHIDPQLQWAGKTERTSFEIDTVSLHVHERIDPKRILESVRNPHSNGQPSLFEENERSLREAMEFYKHKEGWTNRLVAGDSLLVMNSLLEKEAMGGKVQMVYFDPPYGIKYGSNFQPFVNKRDVKDGKDEDLTAEPEMIKAFRDTWELGIHSYLSYLRDRLLLVKELLHESGSCFVQISDENVHHVREIMDEVFGKENFVSTIIYVKTSGLQSKFIKNTSDFLLWYARDATKTKVRKLFSEKIAGDDGASKYTSIELSDGTRRTATKEELENPKAKDKNARLFSYADTTSQGNTPLEFEYNEKKYIGGWKTTTQGMKVLANANRLYASKTTLNYIRYIDDFPFFEITNLWSDIAGIMSRADPKVYVVQTSTKAIDRSLLMTTDPGDLVLDITCGSGTTAYVSEARGRRWITCDTSRVAVALAKQRLMTANFDYYELAHPSEGVSSGFKYKTVPHITLKSIANNEPAPQETLYDQPFIDSKRARITGPFTVEAVPSPMVKPLEEAEPIQEEADTSVARTGASRRQSDWRGELLRAGIRAKGGAMIEFVRIEPMNGLDHIQAEGETKDGKKVYIVFGPEYAPLEQRLVEQAWQEARKYKPDMLIFCSFQFDDEAAKDIDELDPKKAGMQLLKVQMNADLLTDDLLKKRRSNESFWLIGQPDIEWSEDKEGNITIEVKGFDYYNPKTGNVESGGKSKIAMWMLDTDYDERSIFPTQVFFPMAGEKDGWARLAKNLKAEIDEEKIEAYRGTTSLPFPKPKSKKIAVKIIDDRGIESLRVLTIK